ncbi:MAG TPA: peptidylprolyl isomerase [Anaerolineaceae bacterium]|nr:peptidylprolyl isomerase [Anaerolineaceae bacterium]
MTKKHLAKQERERRETRAILIGTLSIAAIVIGLLGYVLVDNYIVKPSTVLATVGDKKITVRDYQPVVKYTRLNMLNQASNYYYYYQMLGSYGSNFLTTAQNLVTSLNSPAVIGEQVLNTMIEDILIEEEAAKRGITVSQEEVAKAMQAAFDFFPEGTPTPTITPTIVNTPTLSLTQIAIIQPTDTPTPLPTATSTPEGWVPTNTSTPTLAPTATSEPVPEGSTATSVPTETKVPTITPTPTAFTTKVYGGVLKDYYKNINTYGIPRDVVERSFRTQLLREKLLEAITADLEPKEEQVWARHILVATEDEAKSVLEALNNGEEWNTLAATYSTDTSNKDNGGDLGWFGRGVMVQAFEDAAFALKPGEISEPVKSDFGYHIIQCVGHAVNDLDASAFATLKQNTFTKWLNDLRASRSDIVLDDRWVEFTPNKPAVTSELYNAIFSGN